MGATSSKPPLPPGTETRRVEILGHYTIDNELFLSDSDEEVRIDRQPDWFLTTATETKTTSRNQVTTSIPYNWDHFCNSVDNVLIPLTVHKKYYVRIGVVWWWTFHVNFFLSVIILFSMDTEWFNTNIFNTIGGWTFLPFLFWMICALSKITILDYYFETEFLHKVMEEVRIVCDQYSEETANSNSNSRIRYEVDIQWIELGRRRRRLDRYYIKVHFLENNKDDNDSDNEEQQQHQQQIHDAQLSQSILPIYNSTTTTTTNTTRPTAGAGIYTSMNSNNNNNNTNYHNDPPRSRIATTTGSTTNDGTETTSSSFEYNLFSSNYDTTEKSFKHSIL